MKKILVFGGSFSPIHQGHIQMIEAAKKEIPFDEILLVVAKTPRWKTIDVDPMDRWNMVELVAKKYGYTLSDIEFKKEGINYTVDTLEQLTRKEEAEWYFLMGGDEFLKFKDWKEPNRIASLCHILVYPRGEKIPDELWDLYHAKRLVGPLNLVSSSEIREMKKLSAMEEEVLAYIYEHRLYFAKKVQGYESKARYEHSCSVSLTARKIAIANQLNVEEALVAGLLHDIGKDIAREEVTKIMQEHFPEKMEMPTFSYHQFVGSYLAETVFHQKEEVVHAIQVHATGEEKMSSLDKVIYASDKIEPTRGYDSSSLIQACVDDLDKGFVEVLEENRKFLLSEGKEIHNPMTDRCFRYYLD